MKKIYSYKNEYPIGEDEQCRKFMKKKRTFWKLMGLDSSYTKLGIFGLSLLNFTGYA